MGANNYFETDERYSIDCQELENLAVRVGKVSEGAGEVSSRVLKSLRELLLATSNMIKQSMIVKG